MKWHDEQEKSTTSFVAGIVEPPRLPFRDHDGVHPTHFMCALFSCVVSTSANPTGASLLRAVATVIAR